MFSLIVTYDGTAYFGWQKTKAGPTIQEKLQAAILQLTQEEVEPEAASRTDRGVHAEGQVIAFPLAKEWETAALLRGLNALLPLDIRVIRCDKKSVPFHPTLDAKGKEYHYRVCNRDVQEPCHRRYSWHYRYPLEPQKMEEAASFLVGTHDFSAFANEEEKNPICTLSEISFAPLPEERLQIVLKGSRFLYKMARNLAGTLLAIGSGKIAPETTPHLLAKKDRRLIGPTAPAHGLFLHCVEYSDTTSN